MLSRPTKLLVHVGALLVLSVAMQCASMPSAWAGSAGILPFSSSQGVPNGAADNIASLVSTEVDIRGGYELVLNAGSNEVEEGCGERSTCISSYGAKNSFEHVITGSVSTAGRNRYTLVLTLYQVRNGKAIRQVLNTLDRSPDSLLEGIPDLVVELLTGQRPAQKDEQPAQSAAEKPALFSDSDDFGEAPGPAPKGTTASEDKEERKWMQRDRHGRLNQPAGEAEDTLGLDEVDDLDLDLDELSTAHQQKKRKERKEREDAARARHTEEERLARVAEEERRQREQQRRQREQQRAQDEERLEREEQRRRQQEKDRHRDEERQQAREDRRRRDEQEQAREDRRRRDEQEQAREDRRRRDEQEQRRDEERRREERARERREVQARERREAQVREDDQERRREEDERRIARARLQEEAEEEERRRRNARDRTEDYEDDVTLDAGIIIIESDDDEQDYQGQEDGEFGILIEEDDDDEPDEPSYNRRDTQDRSERQGSYREDSYGSRSQEQPSERRARSYQEVEEEEPLDLDRRYDNSRKNNSRSGGYGSSRGGNSRNSSARASARTSGKSKRPPGSVRASVGYNYYYLSFLRLGIEGNIYVLPNLSLDLGLQAWMLWLREGEDLELRARVLPNFLIGAAYRMGFHPIVRPFVGGDVGTVIYAAKVETTAADRVVKTPLFALTLAVKGGSSFELPKNFGLFISARVGVSISGDIEGDGLPDIQQYVNETWNPTRVFFNVGVGGLYRF